MIEYKRYIQDLIFICLDKMGISFYTYHHENMPNQIYWKFYYQKMKIFR